MLHSALVVAFGLHGSLVGAVLPDPGASSAAPADPQAGPEAEKDLQKRELAARSAALRYLAREQRPDGSWTDPSKESAERDLTISALALRAILREGVSAATLRAREVRAAGKKGTAWLVGKQQKEGEAIGHFGDPKAKDASMAHAIAVVAFGTASPSMPSDESVLLAACDRIAGFDAATCFTDEESAFEILTALGIAGGLFGIGEITEADKERMGRIVPLGAAGREWLAKRVEGMPRAIALATAQHSRGADPERLAALRAECSRLDPAKEDPGPWVEVLALARALRTAQLEGVTEVSFSKWQDGWLSRLLSSQRKDGEEAGSWPPGSSPFGGSIYATARALEILEYTTPMMPLPPGF